MHVASDLSFQLENVTCFVRETDLLGQLAEAASERCFFYSDQDEMYGKSGKFM